MGGREAWSTPMASHHINLGVLKQPDPFKAQNQTQAQHDNSLEFELDESDVVWSSFDSTTDSSPRLSTATSSPSHLHHRVHQQVHTRFNSSKNGLSAALSDDYHPLVRRKSTLNPSLSASSAARTIHPVNSSSPSNGGFKFHQSAPVKVPAWPKKIGEFNNKNGSFLDKFDEVDDEQEDDGQIVPPHEMVAKSHVTTFSVFEGVGRTLKGRDLRRVRNTIFQKTGFLE